MKNTIKRILLLLPVISVLLVALAVPAFADGAPPVTGTFEPRLLNVALGTDDSDIMQIPVGEPFDVEGGAATFDYRYKVSVDLTAMYANGLSFTPGDYLGSETIPELFIMAFDIDPANIGGQEMPYNAWGFTRMFALDDSAKYLEVEYISGDIAVPSVLTLYGVETIDFYFQEYPPATATNLFWSLPIIEVSQVGEPSPVDGFTSVWTEIMTWITSALNSVMGAFYVDGSLTLLGTLAVIGVSVGIGFLLIGLIQRFLHLRG